MNFIKTTKKTICAFLSAALTIGAASVPFEPKNADVAKAAWDGYNNPSSEARVVRLIDFNSLSDVEAGGGIADRKYATHGYSLYWANHTTTQQQLYPATFNSSVPRDWSEYNKITIKMYSSKATGATLKFVMQSTRDENNRIRYYDEEIKVDWVGWKTLTFEINQMTATNGPDITKMNTYQIVANGNWNMVGNPETELWISDLYISSSNGDFATSFYGEDKIKKAYEALESSVAVHVDGINAVKSDGKYPLSYAIEYAGKKVCVPVVFFKDFLGADVKDDNGSFVISANGNTVSVSADNRINVNGEEKETEFISYAKDNMTYVEGALFGELLGFSALNDKRFLAIGTPQMKEALIRPNSLGVNELNEIAAYESYHRELKPESITPEMTKEAKTKWKLSLVGDEKTNDLTDPDIKYKVAQIDSKADVALKLYVAEPVESPFGDKVLTSSEAIYQQYLHAQNMIMAYACYGSKYYQNEEIFEKGIKAIKWLNDNYFNATARATWEKSGKATGLNNWFEWDVRIPNCIIDSLICVEDKFNPDEIEAFLEYYTLRFLAPFDNGYNYIQTGRLIFGGALLRNDNKRIVSVLDDVLKTYLYVDDNERNVSNKSHAFNRPFEVNKKGSGFFTDGSYVFHTFHPMPGSYGGAHLLAAADLARVIDGTAFEINSPGKFNLADFYYDSISEVSFGSAMYRSMQGRTDNPNVRTSGITPHVCGYTIAQGCDEETKRELLSKVKTAYIDSENKSSYITNLKLDEVKAFKEMIADDSIPVIEDHAKSKVFYNMDRTVHTRNNWGLSIAMSSSRIFNYEAINGQNNKGWYLGDGRTEWLLRDRQNVNGTSQYWSSMDMYRLPGTTVDTQERIACNIYQGNEYLSSKSFVGGVTIDGKYGLSAMDAESYHYDTDFGVLGGGYGGLAPAHKSDLVAKKGYFLLDDGFICLGTGINAKNNNDAEVLTIVDSLLAVKTKTVRDGDVSGDPYEIISAKADQNPEPENFDANAIDGNYVTKWAGMYGEIVFDMGTSNKLGFITLAFQNGQKRKQSLELQISEDGSSWTTVFNGESSGKTEGDEAFDLKGSQARYVKYINKGNSTGSAWTSLTEAMIFPPNSDGSIGLVKADVYGDDPIYSSTGDKAFTIKDTIISGTEWLNMDETAGYWFPSDNKTDNIGELKARWTNDASSHLEIWYSHGINPTDGGYAYGVLPGATIEDTKAFAESGKVKILSNNSDLQAVRDERTNLTYIIFWKAGTFEGITVSDPCTVIAKETENGYKLAFADPSQKLKKATVKINKALIALTCDEFAMCETSGNTTAITYDLSVSPGRTLECEFSK